MWLPAFHGAHKPAYDAYRLPIWIVAIGRHGNVLVWGCARPAHAFGNPRVDIQYAGHRGTFTRLTSVRIGNPRGYFETWVRLRHSGSLRLAWSYPGGGTVYSRTAAVSVR